MTADLALNGAWRWALPISVAAAAIYWLSTFPAQPLLLAAFFGISCAVVCWRPILLFTLALAAFPLLDLAPWSGHRSWDEFDMLLALMCAVAWVRLPRQTGQQPRKDTIVPVLGILVVVSIGVCRALWPWPDRSAGLEYPLSAFNSLYVGKGAAWAVVLWGLARRSQAAGGDVQGAFSNGMVMGLAWTVICVVVERLAFSDLTDFVGEYRVAGPFSAMSLGGAYVECYLVVGTPFLLAKLIQPARIGWQAGGMALLAGTTYALAVTFSRGGYFAMVLAVTVLLLATAWQPGLRARRMLVGGALAALIAAVAYPILSGSFALSRIELATTDLGVRERHWNESLQAMTDKPEALLFGMGLGSYSTVNFWHKATDRRPGGHQLIPNGSGGSILRLGAGSSYYVEQIVSVRPDARYQLRVQVNQANAKTMPLWSLCQKWVIASIECGSSDGAATTSAASTTGFREVVQVVVAPSSGPGLLPRPVRLSVRNPGDAPLDIARVSLVDDSGAEMLRNGDFRDGMDRWTVTSDDHLAWHAKSLPLSLFFELGTIGAVVFGVLLLTGGIRAARGARAGQTAGAALLAALVAFSAVGLFDSLVDTPRFLMLWLLLCLWPRLLPRTSS
jgi:hypothetical protein